VHGEVEVPAPAAADGEGRGRTDDRFEDAADVIEQQARKASRCSSGIWYMCALRSAALSGSSEPRASRAASTRPNMSRSKKREVTPLQFSTDRPRPCASTTPRKKKPVLM